MFWYLIVVVLVLCILHLLLNYNSTARAIRKLPGPKDSFIFGNGLELLRSPVGLVELAREMASKTNGIYRIWIWPLGVVNIFNPEDVEVIVSGMKYHKKSILYKVLRPWLGDGLLLSKGVKWQQRRKILTPAFHFNILQTFGKIMKESSMRLVDTIGKELGKPLDVVPITSAYTLNSICETAMGTSMNNDNINTEMYKSAIYDLGFVFYQRIIKIFYLNDFIFNLSLLGKKQSKHLETVHGFTKKVIEDRKRNFRKTDLNVLDHTEIEVETSSSLTKNNKKLAMLDLLLSAHEDGLIDDSGVQEEVDTFMFEGHDTTASGLTFLFMLLANNRFAQEKIYEELNGIYGDTDRPLELHDLTKMKYLERCIKESLRLYPPVHLISRSLTESVILSGNTIPAGTSCNIHIYDLHRRPDQFPNPEVFDPERFLPENCMGRHPYAYIPFSAGPRNCIGQKFAMMQMKIAISQVLREFSLEPSTKPTDIRIIADVVIRNHGPVNVIFNRRK